MTAEEANHKARHHRLPTTRRTTKPDTLGKTHTQFVRPTPFGIAAPEMRFAENGANHHPTREESMITKSFQRDFENAKKILAEFPLGFLKSTLLHIRKGKKMKHGLFGHEDSYTKAENFLRTQLIANRRGELKEDRLALLATLPGWSEAVVEMAAIPDVNYYTGLNIGKGQVGRDERNFFVPADDPKAK
jgi:hypothetical protein